MLDKITRDQTASQDAAIGKITIDLSAVVFAVRQNKALALIAKPKDSQDIEEVSPALAAKPRALSLPFGSFDPVHDRTFEIALRNFVTVQTGLQLGYVEQLYTFGDKGREVSTPMIKGDDFKTNAGNAPVFKSERLISVGYLALIPGGVDLSSYSPTGASWVDWTVFFPWEDWRKGRPPFIDHVIIPALTHWAKAAKHQGVVQDREKRLKTLFALPNFSWNDERVLERYELLYEAGLALEARPDQGPQDRDAAKADLPNSLRLSKAIFGQPMAFDHRRILATALGRLRGKLKYRPIIFDLMQESFTLLKLQRAVEAVCGMSLHKQNFRRMIEKTGLVEGLGIFDSTAGGRPAEVFRCCPGTQSKGQALGLTLPLLRES